MTGRDEQMGTSSPVEEQTKREPRLPGAVMAIIGILALVAVALYLPFFLQQADAVAPGKATVVPFINPCSSGAC